MNTDENWEGAIGFAYDPVGVVLQHNCTITSSTMRPTPTTLLFTLTKTRHLFAGINENETMQLQLGDGTKASRTGVLFMPTSQIMNPIHSVDQNFSACGWAKWHEQGWND